MTQWQPIETAPKDGTRVLAWIPQRGIAEVVRWEMPHDRSGYRTWCLDEYVRPYEAAVACPPTLWQPLPDAPIVSGDIATLSLQYGEDGNLRIWSEQFPGLALSHKDHDLVMADVLPALKVMGWPAPPVLPIDGEKNNG